MRLPLTLDVMTQGVRIGSPKEQGQLRFSYNEGFEFIAVWVATPQVLSGSFNLVQEYSPENFRMWLRTIRGWMDDNRGWLTNRVEVWLTQRDLDLIEVWLDSTLLGL